MNTSFVLFTKINEVVKELTNEQKGQLFQAILDYQESGEVPDMDVLIKLVFLPIKHDMDYCTAQREEATRKKSEAGKRSAEVRSTKAKQAEQNEQPSTPLNTVEQCSTPLNTVQHNVNVNINEDVNVNNKKHIERGTRSAHPTLEDVKEYLREYHPDNADEIAEKFFDHFTSNGWKVGGRTPMKDWKAAVRNWCRNENSFGGSRQRSAPVQTRFHNLEQRDEDMDEEALKLSMRALGL